MAAAYKNIRDMFLHTLKHHSLKNAFTLKTKTGFSDICFFEYYADIKALAASLINMGLCKKRIAVIGTNCYEWCVAYFAVLLADAVVVPLDNHLFGDEISRLLKRSKASAVIFSKRHNGTMKEYDDIIKISMDSDGFINIHDKINEGRKFLNKNFYMIDNLQYDENAMSILMFTSGTTDESKGVMLSLKNVLSNTHDLSLVYEFEDNNTYAAMIPMHHAFGCASLTLCAATGIRIVFPEGLKLEKCLKDHTVTVMVGVPAIYNAIYKKIIRRVEHEGKTQKLEKGIKLSSFLLKFGIDIRKKLFKDIYDALGSNIRLLISGASALDEKISVFFNSIGIKLIQGYGLTETSPVLCAERKKIMRSGSVGKPLDSVEIMIHEPNENGIGEIIAKGPNIMLGYYENEEATKKVLKDGWFYTGDMGYIDSDGYIFIKKKKKNVIVLANGKNVYPEELEQLINNIAGVSESLVYANTLSSGREQICAAIVYDKDIFKTYDEAYKSIEKNIDILNENLIGYKQIKHIDLSCEPMEKTTTAKIKRNAELEKIKKQNNDPQQEE